MHSKTKILWLSALSCNGNSHSFLNSLEFEALEQRVEWLYHPILESTFTLLEILSLIDFDVDILIIEGSLDRELKREGVSFDEVIYFYAKSAKKVLTVGSCASFGGVFMGDFESRSGLHFKAQKRVDNFCEIWDKTITLSGCPIHPEILTTTLFWLIDGEEILLDSLRRPKQFYAYTIHNGCLRNEYFEYKIDEFSFGELEGCMFYDFGCQGTYTHGSCNKLLWSEVSSKTRVGQPCFGCTEPTFPQENLWKTKKYMGIPAKLPLGVPKRAYLSITGVAKAFKLERFYKRLMDDSKINRED
jgi:hydrogenase small subunit